MRPTSSVSRSFIRIFALLVAVLASAHVARAEDKSGLSPSRLSLPKGPGSLGGVGENVEPNLNLGLSTYAVKVAVPEGYPGLTPGLDVTYSSGAPGAEVGIGWSLPVAFIQRMTSRGLPRYTTEDAIAAGESNELVRVVAPEQKGSDALVYRARQEGAFVRYTWLDSAEGSAGYWKAEWPDGRVGFYGASPDGQTVPSAALAGPDGTFRWYLSEVRDALGHRLTYDYVLDGTCVDFVGASWVYSGEVARYQAVLDYEPRPDPLSDGRPGFEVVCSQRLRGIRVLVAGQQLRRYRFSYEDETAALVGSPGISRLSRVTQYGVNDDGPFPVSFAFGYTSGFGQISTEAVCGANGACVPPHVETVAGGLGLDLRAGTADFIDFNGDSLPDVLDTSGPHHRIFMAGVAADGSHFFEPPIDSTATSASLGLARVQLVDLDGNGFSDLTDLENLRILWNRGNGDWEAEQRSDAFLPDFSADADLKFLDIDGDKQIDVIHSDAAATFYYLNQGGGKFTELVGETAIGASFSKDGLQLADMNGDGLLDAVLVASGVVSVRTNLGRGRWTAWHDLPGLPSDWGAAVRLSDIDGDGLADLVLVQADAVLIALNRAGRQFQPLPAIRGSATLALPIADESTSVRLLDMNGNGSIDVVWVDASGRVSFLDLFPQRPNLLETIDNGIGKQINIGYGSSVAHMTQDGGPTAWKHRVPHPMLTVDRIEAIDTLSGSKEAQSFHYSNGYYDGEERQFRGFADVSSRTEGDDSVAASTTSSRFDVGDIDRYRYGLLLGEDRRSGDRDIDSKSTVYGDCDVFEALAVGARPVRFLCPLEATDIVKEGSAPSEWLTTQERWHHDDRGNVDLDSKLGIVAQGAAGCAPCGAGAGAVCGPHCDGDESTEEMSFVAPNPSGRWLLHLPASRRQYSPANPRLASEERYYYDGESFIGLPLGVADRGLLTRSESVLDASSVVAGARFARDANGAVVESRDPLGHRRTFAYDATSLRLLSETMVFDSPEHAARSLSVSASYDPILDTVVSASAWSADANLDSAKVTSYTYDSFGRLTAILLPGDAAATPSETFQYDLAAPVSRVVHRSRSTSGGQLDLEEVQCFDGFGRNYQNRLRVEHDAFRVSGFSLFNTLGKTRASFQSYEASGDRCERAAPAGVSATHSSYDGLGRLLSTESPDAAEHGGTASRAEVSYLPLATVSSDEEDNASDSAHRATPTTTRLDGLGRVISVEREQAGHSSQTRFRYDELGRLSGYIDGTGAVRTQSYDLLGRLVAISDPDSGKATYEYDAAGNEIEHKDAAWRTVHRSYDEANRLTGIWDPADRDATRVSYEYDSLANCAGAHCADLEGHLARISYPDARSPAGRGEERYGYDVRGHVVYTARQIAGAVFEFTTDFDNAGRVVRNGYPGGQSVEQVVDGASRVSSIPGFLKAIDYDPRGGTHSVVFQNGVTTSYGYDALARLLSIDSSGPGGKVLQRYRYGRDRVGNVTSVSDESGLPGTLAHAAYEYDDWYRVKTATLTERSGVAETLSYEYDDADSILRKTSSLGSASAEHVGTYSYDPTIAPHRPTRAGDLPLAYDAAGYLQSKSKWAFAFDYRGRLEHADDGGKARVTYEYGPGIEPKIKRDGDSTTLYVAPDYEIRDGIAELYVRLGNTRVARSELKLAPPPASLPDLAPGDIAGRTFEPQPDQRITAADAWVVGAVQAGVFDTAAPADPALVGELLMASANRMLADSEAMAESVRFLHADDLGSTRVTTNADGEREQVQDSYPYGLPRMQSADFREPYGFVGKEAASTGMLAMGARQYDAQLALFISPDPALFAGFAAGNPHALHPYSYASDNPLLLLDASGNAPDEQSTWTKLGGFMRGVGAEMKQQAVAAVAQGARSGVEMLALGPAYIAVQTARGVINTAQGMADAYREDGGGLTGVLSAINTVNPALRAMETGYTAYTAWEKGDYETSGREAFKSLEATVETVGIAVAGAKLVSRNLEALANPCNCFAAGTTVVTASGDVPIEQIRAGDLVLSRDVATGDTEYQPVTAVTVTPNDPLIELREASSGESIVATPWHPFWVDGRGWTRADQLIPGSFVSGSGDASWQVASSFGRSAVGDTYNLEVAEYHTYFVGHPALWVHNCPLKGGSYKEVRKANKGGEVHHIPSDSVNGMKHSEGPGIIMDADDHRKTASWGRSADAEAFRERERSLIEQGKFGEAQQLGIDDVRAKFGNKYDEHLQQLPAYPGPNK